MADLNFPSDRAELDPPQSAGPLQTGDTYSEGGTVWVYDADVGAWGSGTGSAVGDVYLSKVNDDNAAGEITFEALSTHEAGVSVTGGRDLMFDNGTDQVKLRNNTNTTALDIRTLKPSAVTAGNSATGVAFTTSAELLPGNASFTSIYNSYLGSPLTTTGNVTLFSGAMATANAPSASSVVGYRTGSLFNTNSAGEVVGFDCVTNINSQPAGGAATRIGFRSNVSNNTSESFNFYADGNAPNYFNGQLFAQPNSRNSAFWTNFDSGFLKTYSPNGATVGSGSKGSAPIQVSVGQNWSTTKHLFSVQSGLGSGGSICTASGGDLGFNNTSDYRIKTNIQDYSENASEKIKALRLVSYTRTDFDIDVPIGFIAHELQEQCPEAVFGEKDAVAAIGTLLDWDGTELKTDVVEPEPEELTYTEEVETDGVTQMVTRTRSWNATGTRDVLQGIDPSKLIPLLTKSLQEALARLEAIEANEVIDDATDSALLTLVANLATRVSALENA